MRLQSPRRDVGAEPPDVAEQLLAREDAVGIQGELDEQRVLLRRQLHFLPGHHHTARGAVDRERGHLEQLEPRRAAPEESMDPREQLLVDERPGQAVVGAGERAHAGCGIRTAEHDHRAIGDDRAIERLGVAEHEQVGIRRARQLVGALAGDDVEPVVAKLALEETANGRFGLGEEERLHVTEATRDDPRVDREVILVIQGEPAPDSQSLRNRHKTKVPVADQHQAHDVTVSP